MSVSISWSSATNDFNLYVYDSRGSLVGAGTGAAGTSEGVALLKASGTYDVLVVPVVALNARYSGSVHFSSQAIPKPHPPSQPQAEFPCPAPRAAVRAVAVVAVRAVALVAVRRWRW